MTRRQFVRGVAPVAMAIAGFVAVLLHGGGNQAGPSTTARRRSSRTPEERQFLAATERLRGRPLTEQEANFAIAQGRWFGDF
jgi:hypothetical protein